MSVELPIGKVLEDARDLLVNPCPCAMPELVLTIIEHENLHHSTPPVELSPKERDLIRFAAAVYHAVENELLDQQEDQ